MTKNCQICSFCQIFVTFMKLFLSEFKYILNFDTFLPHFLAIFVSFLTHFGFWHIFVRFTEIFDSYLSQFCVLTHFWHIFVSFCYIFDTFLKWQDLHWQGVPKFLHFYFLWSLEVAFPISFSAKTFHWVEAMLGEFMGALQRILYA